MRVSVIIPNYNGIELLKRNLPHLDRARHYKNNNICEVIIVDDFSYDESVNFIKKNYPWIRIIKHTKNRGFSSAVNTGVRSSNGSYICLLNSDVIPSEKFLSKTLNNFLDEAVFAVSFHEDGYGPASGSFINGFIEHQGLEEFDAVMESFWANGGSSVIRKSYWNMLGGFDEKLFSPYYWEDVDLSYRALKRGWKVLWDPNAHVFHEHESTIKKISLRKRNFIQQRNQLLFIWKNITSRRMFRKHMVGLFTRIFQHPGYIRIVFGALIKIKQAIRGRHKEAKESKISDEVIFSKYK